MNTTIRIRKNGNATTYDNVLAHKLGDGQVWLLKDDGDQLAITGFDSVEILLDEEGKAKFKADIAAAEARAEMEEAEMLARQERMMVEDAVIVEESNSEEVVEEAAEEVASH